VRILLTADPMIPVPPVGYGGIERIVDSLLRHLRLDGHIVGLVAHAKSTASADFFRGWRTDQPNGAFTTFQNALTLRRAVAEFRPHVVHSFSRLAYLLPLLPGPTRIVMSYQRHTGGRQVAWCARIAGKSLRFTGCSEFICRQGRAAGGKWHAIHNFVDLAKFTFSPQVPPDAPLVFLSRIEDIKGPDVAIEIARASKRKLILAGNRASSGPQLEFFKRRIAPHLDGTHVEWIGEVDDEAKNTLLGKAAALLVPIRWDEPFGIVFAEALACGTPVITFPRGAAPEIVYSERNGFLIESVSDGVSAVRQIETIRREACRRDVETRFSAAPIVAQYEALYRQLLTH
jgi:glycosyltransferase involved in cell wall biosynthesis